MVSSAGQLPKDFKDLEPWVDSWALPSQAARYERRRTSSMVELQAFYNALLPRMDAIIGYLTPTSPADFDARQNRLMNLALMFIEVAMAVELFHEPDETRAMPGDRYRITEGAATGT